MRAPPVIKFQISAKRGARLEDAITISRANARAKALSDDLDKAAGTSRDKGVELDALTKLPESERKRVIDRAKAGERISARKEPKLAADPLFDVAAPSPKTTSPPYLSSVFERSGRRFALRKRVKTKYSSGGGGKISFEAARLA